MATTKIWKVQKRLDHVIDYATNEEKTRKNSNGYGIDKFDSIRQVMTYATNPDKTEKQFYTTGINCEVKDSVKQMQLVKMIYGKENGILAFHAYQSFNEGEVTPEIVHEIGVKLANEMWGDRFQVVISTHLNTEHLHNHFVINSVSFKDGKKYYSNLTNTALLRKTSDEICEEYGLSVLTEKTCKYFHGWLENGKTRRKTRHRGCGNEGRGPAQHLCQLQRSAHRNQRQPDLLCRRKKRGGPQQPFPFGIQPDHQAGAHPGQLYPGQARLCAAFFPM